MTRSQGGAKITAGGYLNWFMYRGHGERGHRVRRLACRIAVRPLLAPARNDMPLPFRSEGGGVAGDFDDRRSPRR